jgi:hypothetical protein
LDGLFSQNKRVKIVSSALGAHSRKTVMAFLDNGTTEFKNNPQSTLFETTVTGVSDFLNDSIQNKIFSGLKGSIGCIKLNIEGGEYDILEQLIRTGEILLFRTLIIQFHRQPTNWKERFDSIEKKLIDSHRLTWRFHMVWERWDILN